MQTGRDPNQPGRQMDNLGVGVGWEGFLPSPSLSYGPALAPLPLGHPPQLYILQSLIKEEAGLQSAVKDRWQRVMGREEGIG